MVTRYRVANMPVAIDPLRMVLPVRVLCIRRSDRVLRGTSLIAGRRRLSDLEALDRVAAGCTPAGKRET
jgi:hypothetical protein